MSPSGRVGAEADGSVRPLAQRHTVVVRVLPRGLGDVDGFGLALSHCVREDRFLAGLARELQLLRAEGSDLTRQI